jgi:hypothetical protein
MKAEVIVKINTNRTKYFIENYPMSIYSISISTSASETVEFI